MNVLILNHYLQNFAGSETQALEIYEYFKSRGDTVKIYASIKGTPILDFFDKDDVFADIADIDPAEFDLVWAQHNLLGRVFKNTNKKQLTLGIISVHLSPFTQLELSSLPYMSSLANIFVVNSEETKQKLLEFSIPEEKILVSGNPAPDSFKRTREAGRLKNILVVSNHVPQELKDAADILQTRGISVDFLGHGSQKQQRVDADLLAEYDVIVTIGKTVQYALLGQIPVYNYDHFGGCGYLNAENFEKARNLNFSGRGFEKKTAQTIADEIEKEFSEGIQFATEFSNTDQFLLSSFMETVLKKSMPKLLDEKQIGLLKSAYPIEECFIAAELTRMYIDEESKSLKQQVEKLSAELHAANQQTQMKDAHIAHIEGSLHQQLTEAEKLRRYSRLFTYQLLKPLFLLERNIQSANRYRNAFRKLVKEKGSIGKAYQYLRKHYKQTKSWRSTKQLLKQTISNSVTELPPMPALLAQSVTKPADQTCALKVAIIAEMSIPQCKKYRVIQKQEMLEAAGIPCSVTSWTDYDEARRQISLASTVIFYRVPGFDSVMSLIDECRRLKIKTYWEVDDLIFDEDILKTSSTINYLDKEERNGVINDARLYRKAMLACDEGVASTSGLAKAMQEAGLQTVHIIENALDKETLATAEKIGKRTKLSDGIVRIIYGSGTKTHNIDFMESAPALAETLKKHPNVRFRYIGFLELPDYFDAVKAQIEHIPFCSYPEYLAHLAECDISIAPLENFIFNDAKSNIKYLEASITHLASVCSPRAAFADVIEHGQTGMLADSNEQWLTAFENLIQDAELRRNIAEAANKNVMTRYSPDVVGKLLADIVDDEAYAQQQQTKVMTFNVYYAPQSFGGATVVAEQINKLLASDGQHQVYAVTTLPVTHYLKPYHTIRYEYNGVTVFGVAVPPEDSAAYENPRFSAAVEEIIGLVKPDIAHLHCIQGIGVEIVDVCKWHGIKTIVTLHDAWWICPNQFMLDDKNRFREDWDLNEFPQRHHAVGNALLKIDMAVSPSQYFTDLHKRKANRTVYTNKNGVRQPKEQIKKRKQPIIRFGYVGGMTEIKGVHLILAAFKKYNFADTELVIVDNTLNMGSQSFFDEQLQGISHYKIVPAYNQDTIDEFFASIDVLLFPSQWKESFGLTVREAVLRDVWVITTDSGGASEDIMNGKNGTVIPFDSDVEELSKAIREVCKHYQAMEENAVINLPKAHIRTFEEQKDELAQMYRELLSEKETVAKTDIM